MKTSTVNGLSIQQAGNQTILIHDTAATDMLTRRAGQLRALLACLIGDGGELFRCMDVAIQDDTLWLAADLAAEVELLSDLVTSGEASK
ncbi:hypothetical protein [Paludibacterium yongneupense]|uniref:hypothetical protein n=1 Tax=Paludibacterium yongneupense TaxID=400061 RepID=UPI0004085DD3|nr:hypothetical protein [Paludibacterium yongneupense]